MNKAEYLQGISHAANPVHEQVMAFKVTLKTPSGEETIEVDGEVHSPCHSPPPAVVRLSCAGLVVERSPGWPLQRAGELFLQA